jgi:hypothetical protein
MADTALRSEELARQLHALHEKHGLLKTEWSLRWAVPEAGFLLDKTLKPKLHDEIVNKVLKDHPGQHIEIGYLWDWGLGAEGIAFTDTALFVTSPKNSERFSVSYDLLESATYERVADKSEKITLTTISGTRYLLDSSLCKLPAINSFLQTVIAMNEVSHRPGTDNSDALAKPSLESMLGTGMGLDSAAHAQAAAKSAADYAENIIPVQPHGVWAEKGNHLYDKVMGKKVKHLGGDNAPNGADRSVDGVLIQSKYHKTASSSIESCFGDDGVYRYKNPDGTPMQVEVPKDQYEAAVKAMARRIKNGQVPGVTDPDQAREIVRQGNIIYRQSILLAKAGTIESLTYDTVNGVTVAGAAFGLSSVVSLAIALWNGKSLDEAMSEALSTGFKVGGIALLSSVLSAQLSRTALDGTLRIGTDWLVNQLGTTTTERLASALAGKVLTGDAAVNALSKLMRGNIIAATATTLVLSAADIYRIFEGGISGMQFFKNVTRTASGVAGGMAGAQSGALGGAALGTAIFPGPGTAIGGVIGGIGGGIGGGFVVQWATNIVLDKLIDDDAAAMLKILEDAFMELAQLYLLNNEEAEQVMKALGGLDVPARLRAMHAAADRMNYGRQILEPLIERTLRQRQHVGSPSDYDIGRYLKDFIQKTTLQPNSPIRTTAEQGATDRLEAELDTPCQSGAVRTQ